jgi:uncharacterized membrane protein
MRYEQSVVVNAPADAVFAYISDLTKLPEWGIFSNVVRETSDGDVHVGSTYECDGKQFGKSVTDNVTVVEYVPGKRFVTETKGETGVSRNTFELEGQAGATKVTKVLEFLKPALVTRLGSPMLRFMAPKNLGKDLEKIKANIEGTA